MKRKTMEVKYKGKTIRVKRVTKHPMFNNAYVAEWGSDDCAIDCKQQVALDRAKSKIDNE